MGGRGGSSNGGSGNSSGRTANAGTKRQQTRAFLQKVYNHDIGTLATNHSYDIARKLDLENVKHIGNFQFMGTATHKGEVHSVIVTTKGFGRIEGDITHPYLKVTGIEVRK